MDQTVDNNHSDTVHLWGINPNVKPPSWDDIQALMPWAELDADNEEHEIVIYTGLTVVSQDGDTEWMEGMI